MAINWTNHRDSNRIVLQVGRINAGYVEKVNGTGLVRRRNALTGIGTTGDATTIADAKSKLLTEVRDTLAAALKEFG